MHILLTNDDGIHAPGLRALAGGFIAAGHRVTVCAPDRERSAASHSVTLGRALKAAAVDYPGAENAWAVDGTPSDCASLGLWLTREDPVDLVAAGVNCGMNQGGAVVYSGTVGAAMEAAMCGTQALAVSLCVKHGDPADFTAAARLAVRVAEWMPAHPLPLGCLYNLNVPPLPYEQLRGLTAANLFPTFMGPPVYAVAGEGYRYHHNEPLSLAVERGDTQLTDQGYATITRLTWDLRHPMDDGDLNEIGL